MLIKLELEQEKGGRWLAEVPDLPGILMYGQFREEVSARAKVLALCILADRLEHGETMP
ncbi:MAG: type II toxin-antitoxin system HicB family antitoxin [Tunicatimonas sp.]